MKKLLAIFLIIALLLPVSVLADYSPALNMTINDFLLKYNAVQASLEAPYLALDKPFKWSLWDEYHLAWFKADKNGSVTILLMTKDPSDAQMLTSGLDMIQIFSNKESDFVPLISITNRCASIFAIQLLGTSFAPQRITQVMNNYYENNCKEKGLVAYSGLDENNELVIAFFYDGQYYFEISSIERYQ